MFADKLHNRVCTHKTVLCTGLDLDFDAMPSSWARDGESFKKWGESIITRTAPYTAVFKPNMGFYLKTCGVDGLKVLAYLADCAHEHGVPVILDCKFGDGAQSARMYAESVIGKGQFGKFDAMTIETTIADPGFIEYVRVANECGRGLFLVVRTSFKTPAPSRMEASDNGHGWTRLATMVRDAAKDSPKSDQGLSNIGAVVGATASEDAERARRIMPDSIFLVPGFGVQGGSADDAIAGARQYPANSQGFDDPGLIANSSRGITHAHQKKKGCDPLDCIEEAAVKARDALTAALLKRSGIV